MKVVCRSCGKRAKAKAKGLCKECYNREWAKQKHGRPAPALALPSGSATRKDVQENVNPAKTLAPERCNEARSSGNAKEPKKWCGICSKHKAFRMYVCPDCIVEGRKLLQKKNAALKAENKQLNECYGLTAQNALNLKARAEKAEAELTKAKAKVIYEKHQKYGQPRQLEENQRTIRKLRMQVKKAELALGSKTSECIDLKEKLDYESGAREKAEAKLAEAELKWFVRGFEAADDHADEIDACTLTCETETDYLTEMTRIEREAFNKEKGASSTSSKNVGVGSTLRRGERSGKEEK